IIFQTVVLLAALSYVGHILLYARCDIFALFLLVIFQTVAVLAALSYAGHILLYAPRDIFACRLATA
ncbi:MULTISPECIES: hypothetical protein, partial [Providencia]